MELVVLPNLIAPLPIFQMDSGQELIERQAYFAILEQCFERIAAGTSGHTIFLIGEAGVGKTSLVNSFTTGIQSKGRTYFGACDSLIYPRPLGPLHDIASQVDEEFQQFLRTETDRAALFNYFLERVVSDVWRPVIIVIEDVHWADEATIEMIKLLARRIHRYKCLFIVTLRYDEVPQGHPLRSLFSELLPETFTRLRLERLSLEAVTKLSKLKGVSGEEIYNLTGGNPFYVTEILASYSPGIPERVKDSVLSVFNSRDERIRQLWEMLSIMPSRIDWQIARRIDAEFPGGIDEGIEQGVLIAKPDHLSFKHELYRLAIEQSLSPLKSISLHEKVLGMMQSLPPDAVSLSRLVHHARSANDRKLVAAFAPKAAQEAASVGAHIEASNLYATALEFTDHNDPSYVELLEKHAYECYLTNQLANAVASQRKAVEIWRARKILLREGNALRFLSRLLWFLGKSDEVYQVANAAAEILENGFPTRERALSYSNLSQLHMLSDRTEDCIIWGDKAIALATRMGDEEILCHALNNVGTVLLKTRERQNEGKLMLEKSLSIALQHNFQEHAARAYTNFCSTFLLSMRLGEAVKFFDEGIRYCEDHDLGSWKYYMLSEKVVMLVKCGMVTEAEQISMMLYANANHPNIVRMGAIQALTLIRMRQGQMEEASGLIQEGMELAMPTNEIIRIVPLVSAWIELSWLTGQNYPVEVIKDVEDRLLAGKTKSWPYSHLTYWKHKAGLPFSREVDYNGPLNLEIHERWEEAANAWMELGAKYEHAIALFKLDEPNQKRAIQILTDLNFNATAEFFKKKLRSDGVRNIPRRPHETTRSNPAQLTNRQVEILKMLKLGHQNKEIAEKLFISQKTVDAHVSAIFEKLVVNSRAKAVIEAERLGILS